MQKLNCSEVRLETRFISENIKTSKNKIIRVNMERVQVNPYLYATFCFTAHLEC